MNTNLEIILNILYTLTPTERCDLLNKIEEVYCLDCGNLQYQCKCIQDDRW